MSSEECKTRAEDTAAGVGLPMPDWAPVINVSLTRLGLVVPMFQYAYS
jgi:hypothetical protein